MTRRGLHLAVYLGAAALAVLVFIAIWNRPQAPGDFSADPASASMEAVPADGTVPAAEALDSVDTQSLPASGEPPEAGGEADVIPPDEGGDDQDVPAVPDATGQGAPSKP